jgi:Protein of unknown function (DUF2795)
MSHADDARQEDAVRKQAGESLAPDEEITGGTAAGMRPRDVADRAELARFLQPSVFPATAERLVASASETQAPGHVMRMLRSLPREERYDNVQDLWRALGGGTEDVTHRA